MVGVLDCCKGEDQRHESRQAGRTAQKENERRGQGQAGGDYPGNVAEGAGSGQERSLKLTRRSPSATLDSSAQPGAPPQQVTLRVTGFAQIRTIIRFCTEKLRFHRLWL
jgi:hypothetical protein